jgi:hypothetical protein
MRAITSHVVNPANDRLRIDVLDEPGQGNACHQYGIYWTELVDDEKTAHNGVELGFQNGPISVDGNGVNGVTHEALIAILIDRLQGFQSGPYACRENALALTKLEEAAHWLAHRTRARMARGVEGSHTV